MYYSDGTQLLRNDVAPTVQLLGSNDIFPARGLMNQLDGQIIAALEVSQPAYLSMPSEYQAEVSTPSGASKAGFNNIYRTCAVDNFPCYFLSKSSIEHKIKIDLRNYWLSSNLIARVDNLIPDETSRSNTKREEIKSYTTNQSLEGFRNSTEFWYNQAYLARAVSYLAGLRTSIRVESELSSLVDRGWPIARATIEAARTVVDACILYGEPQIKPSADGEIGLFWVHNANRVEVVLDPEEQRLVWIAKFHGKFERGDDISWADEIPTSLLETLARLFS